MTDLRATGGTEHQVSQQRVFGDPAWQTPGAACPSSSDL
jgi:hypothetical protein